MQVTDSTEYWTMTFRAKIGVRVLTVAVCGGLWAWFLYEFPGVLLRGGWPIVAPLFLVLFVITFRAMWVAFVSLVVLEQDGIVFRRKGKKIKKAYGDLVSVRRFFASPLLKFASGERVRISFVMGGLSFALLLILHEKRPDLFPEDDLLDLDALLGKDLVLQAPRTSYVRQMALVSVMWLGYIVAFLAIPGMRDHWILFLCLNLGLMCGVYELVRLLRDPKVVFARDDITIVHRNGPTVRISYSEVSSVRQRWDNIYITFKDGERVLLKPGMGDIKLGPLFIATVNPDADIDDRVLMDYPFFGQKIPVLKVDRYR